ncbi:MAG: IS3 family transposase [bacterium]|nr:IS3 family transposase [bacterium]
MSSKKRPRKTKTRRKRRQFTPEFKADVVRLCQSGTESIGEVCRRLELTETAVRRWVKQAEVDEVGGTPEALSTSEREELARLRRENRRLKMEREILKKANGLLREGKLVRFEFIHEKKAVFPLTVLCSVMRVSRSGYYRWLGSEPSERQLREERRVMRIRAVYNKSRRTYGSPRVCAELRKKGEVISPKTVAKIMKNEGICARPKRKFKRTTDSRNTKRIAPNLLERDFTAKRPNQVWVTDVTAFWTVTGWCYLAAIVDIFSRRIVGWAMSGSNDTQLALAALNRAIGTRRPPHGLIHHSDRGSPYGSDDYIAALEQRCIVRSMSRKGDCWDNAVAESFFATIEHELRRRNTFSSPAEAWRAVRTYVDFYNSERIHSTLGNLCPIEFELGYTIQQQAA